jgi:hypothetical protein
MMKKRKITKTAPVYGGIILFFTVSLILLVLNAPVGASSSDAKSTDKNTKPRGGFINGGMLYHIGAGFLSLPYGEAHGLSSGLGGRLAFTVLPGFRIGGMGFNTGFDFKSANNGSNVNLRFGGLTAEYGQNIGSGRLSLGILLGGGLLRTLFIHEVINGRAIVSLDTYNTMVAMPMLIGELPLGEKISVALMGDWILGSRIAAGHGYGPRFHLGVLFNR